MITILIVALLLVILVVGSVLIVSAFTSADDNGRTDIAVDEAIWDES